MIALKFLHALIKGRQEHESRSAWLLRRQSCQLVRSLSAPCWPISSANEFLVVAFETNGARLVVGSRLPLDVAKSIQVHLEAAGAYRCVDIVPVVPPDESSRKLSSTDYHDSN
jgi:hypothetical protein